MGISVKDDAYVQITCMVGLSTNERTICIDISRTSGEVPFLHLEMSSPFTIPAGKTALSGSRRLLRWRQREIHT